MSLAKCVVIALYDYTAQDNDELSFNKDDAMEILGDDEEDEGWWNARKGDQTGLIPSNYVFVSTTRGPSLATMSSGAVSPQRPHMAKTTSQPSESRRKLNYSEVTNSSELARLKDLRREAENKIIALRTAVTRFEESSATFGSKSYSQGVLRPDHDVRRLSTEVHDDSNIQSQQRGSSELNSLVEVIQQKLQLGLPPKDRQLLLQLNSTLANHIQQSQSEGNRISDTQGRMRVNSLESEPSGALTPLIDVPTPSLIIGERNSEQTVDDKSKDPISVRSSRDTSNSSVSNRYKSPLPQKQNLFRTPGSEKAGIRQVPQLRDPRSSNRSGASSPIEDIVKPVIAGAGTEGIKSLAAMPSKLAPTDSRNQQPQLASNVSSSSLGRSPSQPSSISAQSPGFKYPYCKSTIFPPTNHVESAGASHDAKLSLQHIHGYDGDMGKHGGSVRGKNIVFLRENVVVFPAAAVVVVMNSETAKQSFFKGHTEDVSAITCHPDRTICASAQFGSEGRVLVWNVVSLVDGNEETSAAVDLRVAAAVRGISGINFTSDGRFLIALGLDESHTMVVFDWASATAVATAKIGYGNVNQMGFNPYLFVSADAYDDQRILSPRYDAIAANAQSSSPEVKRGCYTLISCAGSQVKFWLLQQYVQAGDLDIVPESGFKGRQLVKPKSKQHPIVRYSLEGHAGSLPKSVSDHNPDILCFTAINDSISGAGIPKSRILTGTSTGAIFIWQQLEVETKKIKGENSGTWGWQPKGRLLSVVTDMHESPLMDLDYFCREHESPRGEGDESYDVEHDDSDKAEEKLITCGKDGLICVWHVNRGQRSMPFEHVSASNACTVMPGEIIGEPRVVCWSESGQNAVVGTTGNFILSLFGEGLLDSGISSSPNPSRTTPSFEISTLVQGHSGKVKRVTSHPTVPMYVSIASDKTLRVWSALNCNQIACVAFADVLTCCTFSIDGSSIVVGTDKGELLQLACDVTDTPFALHDPRTSFNVNWTVIRRKHVTSKASVSSVPQVSAAAPVSTPFSKGSSGAKKSVAVSIESSDPKKQIMRRCEVVDVMFSPTGDLLAVGGKDNLIHILDVRSEWKRVALCRGHTSCIKSMQFSEDGRTLLSSDVARHILFWEVSTGKPISNGAAIRDTQWYQWRSVYGWPVQGVFNGPESTAIDSEINTVCRSRGNPHLLAVGGSNTPHQVVKLFSFPVLPNATPLGVYGGHACPVLDITFTNGDQNVVTAGGNDSCLFLWSIRK